MDVPVQMARRLEAGAEQQIEIGPEVEEADRFMNQLQNQLQNQSRAGTALHSEAYSSFSRRG